MLNRPVQKKCRSPEIFLNNFVVSKGVNDHITRILYDLVRLIVRSQGGERWQ